GVGKFFSEATDLAAGAVREDVCVGLQGRPTRGSTGFQRRDSFLARQYCQRQGTFRQNLRLRFVSRQRWTRQWAAGAGWPEGRLGRAYLARQPDQTLDLSWWP